MTIDRITATKVRIADMLGGKFFQGNKENFTPSYVINTFGRKISRVNIIATITDMFASDDNKYLFITLDDNSGAIRLKAFGDDVKIINDFKVGDEILAIGKVREYNGEIYILPEIVRLVEDFNHISLRRLELLKDILQLRKQKKSLKEIADREGIEAAKKYAAEKLGIDENSIEHIIKEGDSGTVKTNSEEIVVKILKEFDDGNGVELEKILEESKLNKNEIEYVITNLLDNGSLFEPNVGKFKLVG